MKILVIYHALSMGGVASVVANQVNWWAEHGYDITLALFSAEDTPRHHELHPDVKTIFMDLFDTPGNPLSRITEATRRHLHIRKTIKDVAPDVVISHVDTVNVRTLIASIGLGIPVVATEHTDPARYNLGSVWEQLRRMMYTKTARLVVLNNIMRDHYQDRLPEEKIVVLPNPIPLPPLDGTPERDNSFLYLGRLSKEKGVDLLLEAFATRPMDWSLKLAGDGPDRDQLEAKAEALGIASKVTFLDRITEIIPLLRSAGVFVLPSFVEGFPVALCEALVTGTPCLATDTAGAKMLIADGVNGLLVPIGDREALATGLVRLAGDPELCQTLGQKALEVRNLVDEDAVMRQWNTLLQSVIQEGR